MKRGLALLVLVSLTLPALSVTAQDDLPVDTENKLGMQVAFPDGPELFIESYDLRENLLFTVYDRSADAANDGIGLPHRFTVTAEALTNSDGWQYSIQGSSFNLVAGQKQDVRLSVLPSGNAVESDLRVKINVTMEAQYCCGSISQEYIVLIKTPGSQFAFLRAISSTNPTVTPDEVFESQLTVINPGLLDRTYSLDVVSNTCQMFVTEATIFVPAGESRDVTVTVLAPSEKFLYLQETCTLSMQMVDQKSKLPSNSATFSVKVSGTYVDPGAIINLILFLAIVGIIVWIVLAAKRRTEEEILGKPQPPWTLPAEQVYLAELEKRDPQAAYVVRNFLMEDEYASSLLWYKAFKRATRGRRALERKALRMEHSFENWDLKQQEKLADVDTGTDKQVAKLQAKLDKKLRKSWKKDHKKWEKQVGKLEAKASSEFGKAVAAWKKEAKVAKKQGQPIPAEPRRAKLDAPAEPQFESVDLDDHKWASKKERILAKAAKVEASAQSRYENERAKRLERIRSKMSSMADKIDDPEFVAEHPLISGSSA